MTSTSQAKYPAELLFILRRAAWIGRVKRADLLRAFKTMTEIQATRLLTKAVEVWPGYLCKDGVSGRRGVIPRSGVQIPAEASSHCMLALFERGAQVQETGLFDKELPRFSSIHPIYRGSIEIADHLLSATIARSAVEILYVGLRKGERATWRTVLPRAFEFTGRQWRLLAQEILSATPCRGKHNGEIKTFVLPRILSVRHARVKTPDALLQYSVHAEPVAYHVSLNSLLTADQLQAVKNEFGIDAHGTLRMNPRNEYEFSRQYGKTTVNPEIVWPLVHELSPVTRK